MPRNEIERGSFLCLAGWENLLLESNKERIGGSGQGGFLLASAQIRGAKDFRRTASRRIRGRAQDGAVLDEKAIFEGDPSETLCAVDDRFKTRFRIQSESTARSGG